MADHPTLSAQLRTPAPTLEPDDVLLARLSALAAAGAPAPASAAAPRVNWRVGLAAASVAAVVVGAAWVGGLGGTEPRDEPGPANTPTAPGPSPSTTDSPDATRSPGTSITSLPGGLPAGPGSVLDPDAATSDHQPNPPTSGAGDPASTAGPGEAEGSPGQGHDDQGDDHPGQGDDQGDDHPGQSDDHPGQGQGPDEHAGDHPDEHASTHPSPPAGGQGDDQTTADKDQAAGDQSGDGAGGRQPR